MINVLNKYKSLLWFKYAVIIKIILNMTATITFSFPIFGFFSHTPTLLDYPHESFLSVPVNLFPTLSQNAMSPITTGFRKLNKITQKVLR